jgi:hypothetical protein
MNSIFGAVGASDRSRTAYGDPMHAANLRVISDSIVLGATIVPKSNRILFPAKPTLVLGMIDVRMQEVQEGLTFPVADIFEVRCKMPADE